jgi:endogenous inhibitor of DNA gyrase (YacG/DUF329 family)
MHPKSQFKVHCPICRVPVCFTDPPYGPFCSDRCKLVDLGKWFSEDYRTSEPLRPDHFEEFESLEGEALDSPGDP